MVSRFSGRLALVVACLSFAVPAAFAQDKSAQDEPADSPSDASSDTEQGPFIGLLRTRDLSPFGFLRLDMRPAHAITAEKGTFSIEAELGYQNTWALSPGVEEYLTSLGDARRNLGPDEVAAIQALPGENYLLDLELAQLDVTLHYKFADHWSAYAILSGVSYNGGVLDGAIEEFHDAFGFSDFGRPGVKKNDVNAIFNLKSSQSVNLGAPTQGGMLDPTFGVRYSGFKVPKTWNLVVEASVKAPVQGRRPYLSTGRTDYGLQVSLQKFFSRTALYASASGVYYDGSLDNPVTQSQVIPTLVVGVEQKITQKTHIVLQAYASKSVFSREETDLDSLLKNKYQASLGVYRQIGSGVLLFAVTENLQNLNNTPDIGFQLGYGFSPALRGRRPN